MYRVIGTDQKEYGPVSLEMLRQWIAEGRLNGQTMVLPDGASQWTAIASLPEFSGAFAGAGAQGPPPLRPVMPAYVAVSPPKTSGLAITSLVLGILGMCTLGITSLIGLILGIVALVKINRSQGQLGGKGLAIAGVCVSGVFLVILPLQLAIAIPNFAKARQTAMKNACINNLRMLEGAKEQWALENKKQPQDTPTDADLFGLDKYVKIKPVCPAGGVYTINNVATKPVCSISDHRLEPWPFAPAPAKQPR